MKRSLLDIIACPNDKHFPLELKVFSEADAPMSVLEGELFCPSCASVFQIKDGIPQLLSDHSIGDHPTGRDKANEMRARDDQARDYDRLKGLKVLSKLEVPKLLKLFEGGQGDIIVELGAGTGRITEVVAGRVAELVAVDFSVTSLQRARAKFTGSNAHWVQGDVNHLPIRDLGCDHVFSCQVFEHLPGPGSRNTAVDEAARIIRGEGTFIISVYRDSWVWRLIGAKEGYHDGGIYYYRLSGDEFKDLLERRFAVEKFVPNLGFYLQMAKCVKESTPLL